MVKGFVPVSKLFEKSVRENWDRPCISDYHGRVYNFSDVGRNIAKFHLAFAEGGIRKGDRVAICGKNQANWALTFLATFTYGAVPVPLLHEFKPANIHYLVDHCEAKLLFVDEAIWKSLDESQMPGLDAVISIGDFSLITSRSQAIGDALNHTRELFDKAFPGGFSPEDVNYEDENPEDLAIINYTSGTSGSSKGVMIPYRSFWSNMDFGFHIKTGFNNRCTQVAILPAAHMYGMMFELMYQLLCGVHVVYLTRIPSPKIITEAMGEVKPRLVISVPLVIEKIYKNMVKPVLEKKSVRFMRKYVPGFEFFFLRKIKKKLEASFGGSFLEVIIGGAAFNREVEAFFRKMKFRFTVGYGMTECGPIITYCQWDETKPGSSGKVAPNMEIRIDSKDPANIPGEIQCRGANVFSGYFKNEEATAQSFTEDGWFRTGDMGVIDKDGYLYIRGRCKCMLLGPSGQNIYPEEIETVVNSLPLVVESLIIDDHGQLTALVYPDYAKTEKQHLSVEDMQKQIQQEVAAINRNLPNYSQIKKVEFRQEDFERTPKKSIKRYLYQR